MKAFLDFNKPMPPDMPLENLKWYYNQSINKAMEENVRAWKSPDARTAQNALNNVKLNLTRAQKLLPEMAKRMAAAAGRAADHVPRSRTFA